MKFKLNKDITLMTFIIAVSALLYAITVNLPEGSRRYPQGLLIVIGILALIEMITKTVKANPVPQGPSCKESSKSNVRVFAVAVFCLMYVLLISVLGYFSSTIIFGFSLMYYMGMKNVVSLISVVAGMNLFIYLLFILLLRIPMPQGLLF